MKVKAKTKKFLVLSVMVVLLVATGVLNFVLNDKLNTDTGQAGITDTGGATETFFEACRSDRTTMRESEFLSLDAIIKNEATSAEAKKAAEEKQLELIDRMEMESQLETEIKAKGFEDTIVTISESGANVIVVSDNLTSELATQVMSLVATKLNLPSRLVKVMAY